MNPNITWDIVDANLDKEWGYDVLSNNNMSPPNKLNYVLK
jgi:hypothetical protein